MYMYNLGMRFEKVVAANGEKAALRFKKDDIVSYHDLNAKANQLARYLLNIGIERNDVVCFFGDKNVNTFAGMLACLKIGAIYVILDPDSPVERLKKILTTCRPRILFCRAQLEQAMSEISDKVDVEIVSVEGKAFEEMIQVFEIGNLKETMDITAENPAYIMYTSGSTGFPKGAVMTHGNVLNFIDWSVEAYGISSNDVLTNVNPLYFDNSVFDFYSSLFSGASMVPFSKEMVTDAGQLVGLIDEFQCTLWFSVPTLLIFLQTMKALNRDNMKCIKRFIFGGEGYPKAKLKQLFDTYGHRADLHNVYGPTECTCICSSYKITAEDFQDMRGLPPLGKMIGNFSYLILDKEERRVPEGETGELCLLGPNVGNGYFNDLERTEISFVQNPYNKKYVEMMYKTGDLVKHDSDVDKIYVMGRKDNQIKHMGYRIELEEIEAALSCLNYVKQAVALHGKNRGLSQIIAVISSEEKIDEKDVRNDLGRIIPHYMVPSKFHWEKELPRNPNGKIDRRRLAETFLKENPGS